MLSRTSVYVRFMTDCNERTPGRRAVEHVGRRAVHKSGERHTREAKQLVVESKLSVNAQVFEFDPVGSNLLVHVRCLGVTSWNSWGFGVWVVWVVVPSDSRASENHYSLSWYYWYTTMDGRKYKQRLVFILMV